MAGLEATTVRIAMWSGPRNISTALLRSWENRDDTIVCDEPLYAHYLAATGKQHPGREDTLARHEQDWRTVARQLTGPLPAGISIYYQKHMAHHLLPMIDRDWLRGLRHGFLIRDPAEMLPSLLRHVPAAELEDTGLPQQVELFDLVTSWSGMPPPVLDARDILQQPEAMLRKLCGTLKLTFQTAMLQWPIGPRDSDGAWAPYWYQEVWQTSGFGSYRPRLSPLPDSCQSLWTHCQPLYEFLYSHRMVP